MINRDDMLELTRRMTPARASIDRIAGAYFDEEGYVDGTFNTHFLKLSASERAKNLELAKMVLISKTNEQLREYRIPEEKESRAVSGGSLTGSGDRSERRCIPGSFL